MAAMIDLVNELLGDAEWLQMVRHDVQEAPLAAPAVRLGACDAPSLLRRLQGLRSWVALPQTS